MIEDKERKTGEELLMILIKAVVWMILFYFKEHPPHAYVEYKRLPYIAGAALFFFGPVW